MFECNCENFTKEKYVSEDETSNYEIEQIPLSPIIHTKFCRQLQRNFPKCSHEILTYSGENAQEK